MKPEQREAMARALFRRDYPLTASFNEASFSMRGEYLSSADVAWQAAQPWVRKMILRGIAFGISEAMNYTHIEQMTMADKFVARVMEGGE